MLPPIVVTQKAKPAAKPAKSSANPAPAQPAPSDAMAAAAPVSKPASVVASEDRTSTPMSRPLSGATLGMAKIAESRPATSDTASLLKDVPGVSIATGGGVSSLPAIDGLADDRIHIVINGRETTSACANHMNPPLSYADPVMVKKITVSPGVAPVSSGGDNLGGTIAVETTPTEFPVDPDGVVVHGSLSAAYRSNGDGISTGASASAASGNVSLSYAGAWTKADQYKDGDGRIVGSTEYEAQNHTLSLAMRDGKDLYVLEGGGQVIPYQGFVNQPMDMVLNRSWHVGARAELDQTWGKLTLSATEQHTRHGMNFLEDKLRSFEAAGWGANATMPMNTIGDDAGVSIKADIPLSATDTLRIGNEEHYQHLDDWWPPVCDTPFCGMGPRAYLNINGGTRFRAGIYAEWEHKWDGEWTSLLGVRNDTVWMTTGDVAPYEWMPGDIDAEAAREFNARDHSRTDVNFDLTALIRYEPQSFVSLEAGYGRKSRAPNLYERYAWGLSSMTSQMTTWFGDANGYVGNLDLTSEIAHRLSVTFDLHDQARRGYELKVTPYVTYVDDFITAEINAPEGWVNGFNQLRFVNHDALLYGVDIGGAALLAESQYWGKLTLTGTASVVHGEDEETGGALYHMMPWNLRLALAHAIGGWTNTAELQMVAEKTRVDDLRLEPETPGYALLNLRSSYEWDRVRLDVGVENVFDQLYYAPLGGTNYTDYLFPGHAVAGAGRSYYTGLTVKF